eukprot:scaffold36630_cov34-Phaeocystis_antarctica.AAC.1
MGIFGTPKAIFHDENHARQVHRPSTKHLCCGPKRKSASEPRHNAGWKAPIKMPNAQFTDALLGGSMPIDGLKALHEATASCNVRAARRG